MPIVKEGTFEGAGKKFALVASRFNEFITTKLVGAAVDMLRRHGVEDNDIAIVWTPGAFELPVAVKKVVQSGRYNAVVALGCVIRGATPHFEYVAAESAKGIGQVSLESMTPVIYGVLTTDTIEQAIERAGTKAGNKGADAALAALEMVSLLEKL